jgi:hypothetical protein
VFIIKLFKSLEEVEECYGKENLVPVTNLQQIIFYVKMFGLQPKWTDESKENKGRIVCYYLKNESNIAFRKWRDNRPVK